MRTRLLILIALASVAGAVHSQPAPVAPYETDTWATPANAVDAVVQATLKKQGLDLQRPCSDEVFCRRVFVDLIGTLPQPAEVQGFLADKRPDKRAALIESLFGREEFAVFQTLKWCDLLRVKSEFPINLWPNAVQAYHRWIFECMRANMPYDQFAKALLTASGSNFRAAPANFYRAMQGRGPIPTAQAVGLTFLGMRVDRWPEARRDGFAAFFSRVAYKSTGEWKEEIVYLDPKATAPVKAIFPDGTAVTIPAGQDPRQVFAEWLTTSGNKYFGRAIVNRMWYWLMGQGIVQEPDDIRGDNPAACPELLMLLDKELVASKYDLRSVFRLILNSRTYQQSSLEPAPTPEKAKFARYNVRRLHAEVLVDALCWIGGKGEEYSSPIPEPFTFTPRDQRTIALSDGSITSQFLETFGRPSRDTGMEAERNNAPSDAQSLYLLNSTEMRQRIESSPMLRTLYGSAQGKPAEMVRGVYLIVLSRYPTEKEQATALEYLKSGQQSRQALNDLTWALINGKEFLYRH
ncbi:MAG: DUF1553 domain-containing protein [Bacteroidota bacterium]